MTAPDVTRRELHHRSIDLRGYERSDGLFEVESRMIDRKTDDFISWLGYDTVPAGNPIHDMGVRLTFDTDMVVQAVATFTDASPYPICPGGGEALQSLIGLSMTKGWSQQVRDRLSGAAACTHLMHLLMPMATVAFQTMHPFRPKAQLSVDANGRPKKIDSCYAYAANRQLVERHWPSFYTPDVPAKP